MLTEPLRLIWQVPCGAARVGAAKVAWTGVAVAWVGVAVVWKPARLETATGVSWRAVPARFATTWPSWERIPPVGVAEATGSILKVMITVTVPAVPLTGARVAVAEPLP